MDNDQRDVRIQKLRELRERGINPYRDKYERTHLLIEARSLQPETRDVRIAGRVMAIRMFGRLIFATLKDGSGRMQIALQEKTLGDEFGFFKKYVDIGDFIGTEGDIFITKKGETTLNTLRFEILSKTLRPLPEKWHGVQDRELLYRQRYLDLTMNDDTMKKFLIRTGIIRTMREFLDSSGFTEVDTPVLQTKPSGAIATPFTTHHNALDMPLYLRIAPETYLKRCIAGGFDRVYEFARSFRNEGMDPSHLQDFTLLEWYAAYWSYENNMEFTQRFVKHVLREINGSLVLRYGEREIDFSGAWKRITMREIILADTGIDIYAYEDDTALRKRIETDKIEIQGFETMGLGQLIDNLFKKVSRPAIIDPVFIVHHPRELSPLARTNDEDGRITDRFQLVANGWELINAYSELIDPLDQRARLEAQARLHSSGDAEAMVMDEDYLTAMEHGMPPISGLGMGVDRFISLLAGQENLRDVVLFPLMKPREEE